MKRDKLIEQVEDEATPSDANGDTSGEEILAQSDEIAIAFVRQFDARRALRGEYHVLMVAERDSDENDKFVFVQNGEMGSVWAVPYMKTPEGWAFAQEDEWKEAILDVCVGSEKPVEPPKEEQVIVPELPSEQPVAYPMPVVQAGAKPGAYNISESDGYAMRLSEADGEGPLVLDVQLIKPGPGNPRDNHWYPVEVLKRDAHVFVGAKMYESDHGSDKTTARWVSTVRSIKGFTPEGAPIAEVVVHHPDFAVRARNLAKAGLLSKLECSIMATGVVRKGVVDGKEYNVVERIVEGGDVDWVTRAGAGGHAIALAESAGFMSQDEIEAWLEKQPLHRLVKERLRRGEYASMAELQAAAQSEIHYLKEVTGAGRAIGMNERHIELVTLTEEERRARFDAIDKKYGIK